MTQRLIVDELFSVGLVTRGSNGPADVLITKRATSPSTSPTVGTVTVKVDPDLSLWRRMIERLRGGSETSKAIADELDEALGDPVEKARNVLGWMEGNIHADFTQRADDLYMNGLLTREERIAASSAIGEALQAFTVALEEAAPELASRDPFSYPEDVARIAQRIRPSTVAPERKKEEAPMPPTLADDVRAGLPAEVQDYMKAIEESLSETETKLTDAETKLAAADPEPSGDPVEKAVAGLPDDVRDLIKAQIDSATAAADEAKKIAADERDKRLAKEYEARTIAEFSKLSMPVEDLTPIIMKLDTGVGLTADESEKLLTALKTASAMIDDSQFFETFGATGTAVEGSPSAEVKAKVAKLRETETDLTPEQAERKVLADDRDLALRLEEHNKAQAARR